ncbi:helix-turn-helix domain-containing protein [Streptomyces afghaniensis]|uniref:helix-turn-helix domain-containing protein n=1 Tax=Streptomyces afghaniensis TaxID=66865 RepID=UPI002785632F|nr:hypothetical protein [Streptomyces afghaniensis]
MRKFTVRPGFTVLAHKLALDPNATATGRLQSHAGGARAAYNWAVAHVTSVWWQRKAEQSYGIGEDQLTPWRSWSLPELRKAFNAVKHTDPRFASWWQANSKECRWGSPRGRGTSSPCRRRDKGSGP